MYVPQRSKKSPNTESSSGSQQVSVLPARHPTEMASKVRLEGMIGHVLRRRIVKCERQLIPQSLRHLDVAAHASSVAPMYWQAHGPQHVALAPALMRDLSVKAHNIAGGGGVSQSPKKRKARSVPRLKTGCLSQAESASIEPAKSIVVGCTASAELPRKRKMEVQDAGFNGEAAQESSTSTAKPAKSQKLDKTTKTNSIEEPVKHVEDIDELERKKKSIEEIECPCSTEIDMIELRSEADKNQCALEIETWLDQSHKLEWTSHITDFFRTVSSTADFSRTSSAA